MRTTSCFLNITVGKNGGGIGLAGSPPSSCISVGSYICKMFLVDSMAVAPGVGIKWCKSTHPKRNDFVRSRLSYISCLRAYFSKLIKFNLVANTIGNEDARLRDIPGPESKQDLSHRGPAMLRICLRFCILWDTIN